MGKKQNDVALKMLRKLYGYDLALVRQQGEFIGNEQDELESLAIHHLGIQVTNAVQEFVDVVGDDQQMESGAIAILMGICGVISAEIHKKRGNSMANSAITFGQKQLKKRYLEILGENEYDD